MRIFESYQPLDSALETSYPVAYARKDNCLYLINSGSSYIPPPVIKYSLEGLNSLKELFIDDWDITKLIKAPFSLQRTGLDYIYSYR